MIEAGWALLLLLAALDSRARPLAVLLMLKWAASYAAALSGWWGLPPIIDVAAGSLGILMAATLGGWRGRAIAGLFVIVPLVHGWHWTLWSETYVGVQYFRLMQVLFSAQAFILAWPSLKGGVLYGLDRCLLAARLALAGMASPTGVRRQGSEPRSRHDI